MGVPLHLWKQKIFREIGELCGGWIATEEETERRNHLKWARIEIAGDGRNIPSEVTIERDGVKYFIPIWAEKQTRFELGLPKKTELSEILKTNGEYNGSKLLKNHTAKTSYVVGEQDSQTTVDHVGCNDIYFKINEKARARHADGLGEGKLLGSFSETNVGFVTPIGPDFSAQVIFYDFQLRPAEDKRIDSCLEELGNFLLEPEGISKQFNH